MANVKMVDITELFSVSPGVLRESENNAFAKFGGKQLAIIGRG